MSLVAKVIYRFNEIPIKIPAMIFAEIEKPTLVKKKWGWGYHNEKSLILERKK